MDSNLHEQEVRKIGEDIQEKSELEKMAEMIKDNKIIFTYKDKEYRIHLLNQKEKDELDTLRRKKYNQMLQDRDEKGNPSYLTIKELIKVYKEREIADIDEIDDKIKKLTTELNEKRMKEGEALEKKSDDSILKAYKEEIIDLLNEVYLLISKKADLLENCFENTLADYVTKTIAFLSLEIKEQDTYVRAFDKIDDFLSQEDELIAKTVLYSSQLNY